MADKTPTSTPKQLQLATVDVLGSMQRLCIDLHGYLSGPPGYQHPGVIHDVLQRVAELNSYLPAPAAEGTDGKDAIRKAG